MRALSPTADETPRPAATKALIKSGRQKYAELVQRENRLVISLNTADAGLYHELEAWLKSRAEQHFQ